jgi:uracil-DNA glycosylase
MKREKIKEINYKVGLCNKCSLKKGAHFSVPGEGPANAKIIAVGEAPGREEDLTGRPFIGRSGKLLTKLLELAGIKREKVFITSVAKHRPPNNRKPTKEEIKICLPYLLEQIKIINPKKIILLGQTAFSVFFPGEKLKNFRGKLIKKNGRDFFVAYHPAAGLRFQKMKKILEKDFRKLKSF